MTDQELADKVIALGIGRQDKPYLAHRYHFPAPANTWASAELFVRDWRVAGAVMEKLVQDDKVDLRAISLSWYSSLMTFAGQAAGSANPTYGTYNERTSDSAPRAIIEACVEALND